MGVEINDNRLVEQIGQFFIDKIKDNAKGGTDIDGQPMDGYSKEYRESEDFEIYGKTRKVNMTLKGDMLSDLDIIETQGDKITLGFNSELSTLKAANHNGGFTVPTRQFFGVTADMVKEAKQEFSNELQDQKPASLTLAEIFAKSKQNKTAIAKLVDSIWGYAFDVEYL